MRQKCPCTSTNPLAQTVYPLQGGKFIQILKKNSEKISLASTTTRKIRWIHWWNPFLNPLTIKGDICNFVPAESALSNTSQHSVYNYARRPILCTGQHLPCAAFSSFFLYFLISYIIMYLLYDFIWIKIIRIVNRNKLWIRIVIGSPQNTYRL